MSEASSFSHVVWEQPQQWLTLSTTINSRAEGKALPGSLGMAVRVS